RLRPVAHRVDKCALCAVYEGIDPQSRRLRFRNDRGERREHLLLVAGAARSAGALVVCAPIQEEPPYGLLRVAIGTAGAKRQRGEQQTGAQERSQAHGFTPGTPRGPYGSRNASTRRSAFVRNSLRTARARGLHREMEAGSIRFEEGRNDDMAKKAPI